MKESYIQAIAYSGGPHKTSVFSRISEMFYRELGPQAGLGSHYIMDLVTAKGNSGTQVVSIVCGNHDIPVFLEGTEIRPIREIVQRILDLPPRCAVVLDLRDNELLQKVRTRLSRTHCHLFTRKVVFCLTDQEMPAGSSFASIRVPGSIDDRMTMLLYHTPERLQRAAASLDCFRPLAETMVDYALFHPNVWRHVCVDGTLAEFMSTALFQIVRRVRTDPDIEADYVYPSFEKEWRGTMATRLKDSLATPPEALCPGIHRVIPIGVLPQDAMQAMTVAIPTDLQNPYAITVQSSAVDDQCGSIAISQPMQYTVVHVHCSLGSGLLFDVCRELRAGHKAVVSEVYSMRLQHEQTSSELKKELATIRDDMKTLVGHLSNNTADGVPVTGTKICSKHTCSRVVTKRFRSGKLHRQCNECIGCTNT